MQIRAAVVALLLVACEVPRSPAPGTVEFPKSAAADSLMAAASALYDDAEYDSAEVILRVARARAVSEGDSLRVAQADTKIGLAQYHLGNYSEAQKTGEAALYMKIRLGMRSELFKSYNALGLLAYDRGRYSDAAILFAQAGAAADSLNDSLSASKAIGNLGMVHSDVGRFNDARREFEGMFRLGRSFHDTIVMANALANTGMLLIRSGDAQDALGYLERARQLYLAKDYPQGQEMVAGQLGSAYSDLSEPQKAIAYMDSALRIARKYGMRREETEDLEIFAEQFGGAGDHAAGLKFLSQAGLLADSVGLDARRGDIMRAQARELAATSDMAQAIKHAESAVDVHHRLHDPLGELEDRLLLAEIAQRNNNRAIATEQLQSAAALSRSLRLPLADEQLALGTARVADIRADPAQVLRSLSAELTFPHLGNSAAGEADALRARAFSRLHQWPEAVSSGRKAIAALSLVRGRLGEGALRAAFTSDNADVYADLVVALLQLGRTNEAFEIADEARGKALLEHLNLVKSGLQSTSTDLSQADALLRRIDYLTDKLRQADTVPTPERTLSMRKDLSQIADELTSVRSAYETRVNAAARADPRGAALLGAASLGLVDIQKALRSDEMILEYLVSSRTLFVFAASRDTVVARSREIRLDDLANRVWVASRLSSTSSRRDDGLVARRALYNLLIGIVDSIPAVKRATRLIIVPHSMLTYLPFAALVGPDARNLVERKSLLTLQSASALPFLRSAPSTTNAVTSIFAPFPDELAGTLTEAQLVKRELTKSKSYIGSRGNERELRAALERRGNVHVASHGLLDQMNPMFSRVEVAPGEKENPENDGRLDVHELLRMNVKSDLVFLSGCETGAGASWSTRYRRTQDYATLSQALLYAGAQNVVATLWRIDDAGASQFAARFYRALRNGDVVEALAAAQRQTLGDPRFAAPKYWAGYVVSGSALSKPVSQNKPRLAVQ